MIYKYNLQGEIQKGSDDYDTVEEELMKLIGCDETAESEKLRDRYRSRRVSI